MHTKKIHITHSAIRDAVVPVSVALVGVGGTGSHILQELAVINQAVMALGGAGLYVTAYDSKVVNEVTCIRQNFSKLDIGDNKACCLISKINRSYGTNWEAEGNVYDFSDHNIIITAVDDVTVREDVGRFFDGFKGAIHREENAPYYWLDTGNGDSFGQVILGGCGLPTVLELHPNMKDHEDVNAPSCSAIESISRQGLFVNKKIAVEAADMIWNLFYRPKTEIQGVYMNMKSRRTQPKKIA